MGAGTTRSWETGGLTVPATKEPAGGFRALAGRILRRGRLSDSFAELMYPTVRVGSTRTEFVIQDVGTTSDPRRITPTDWQ